ncbi:putative mitochondrial protein [Phytophthora megakarya]|uniref:Putative mitochondrial protein n=1 Tax=Phytophthora megakarya TaxID=4795 RepID=A0A225UH16_9STRA|nr:putative mitochondrial protein [Phytophthora megakarya]
MINFCFKRHANGSVERSKARVCVQGCGQAYRIDYIDTFSPVVKLISIRVVLAECNSRGLKIRQGDVPTAYVKARLSEVSYVKQPKGFEEGASG